MLAGTLFSGIGAPECAAPWIDWRWCAEIDLFASAVHAARFPGVPNLGDVNEIDPAAVEPVDLVVFGSPCQSFSVAGKRLGLDDPRGNLALIGLRLIGKLRPRWVVWENVPGVLSSVEGRDFGAFLWLLGECGYGFAYRVLDAQHFGVPQRRRRVFVVGCLGDWRPAAAVLFEPESLRGDPAPRREAGQGITPILEAGARTGVSTTDPRAGSGIGEPGDPMFTVQRGKQHAVAFGGNRQSGALDVATAVNAHGGPHGRLDFETETFIAYDITGTGPRFRNGANQTEVHTSLRSRVPGMSEGSTTTVIAHSLRVDGFDASEDGTGRGTPLVAVAFHENQRAEMTLNDTAGSLKVGGGKPGQGYPAVAFTVSEPANGFAWESAVAPTIEAHPQSETSNRQTGIRDGMSVRRLTPRECERLQGFPDDWTLITWRGKPAADGPRYRALGNSMAVPVLRWLLGRIEAFEGGR